MKNAQKGSASNPSSWVVDGGCFFSKCTNLFQEWPQIAQIIASRKSNPLGKSVGKTKRHSPPSKTAPRTSTMSWICFLTLLVRGSTLGIRWGTRGLTSLLATRGPKRKTFYTQLDGTPSDCRLSSTPSRPGAHPRRTSIERINHFRKQLKSLGFSFDYDREVDTTDPDYYRWTQRIFLLLLKRGLAYVDKRPVWWCEELATVLANEEVIDGRSERGNHPVVRRSLRQWVLKDNRLRRSSSR